MRRNIIILILCLMLCGCNSKEQIKEEINIEQIMQENEYIIVDVRTKEEYNENHIIDAINIPYDEIDENINLDKNKVIFVYCRSGNRSSIAFNTLNDLGYTVYDLGAFDEIDLPKE